jgi:long-chain acyl-CoA synthetase
MAREGKAKGTSGDGEKAAKPFQVTAKPPKKVLLNPFSWVLWILDFLIYFFCCCCCCCSCVKAFAARFAKNSTTNPDDSDSDWESDTRRRRTKQYWEDGLQKRPFEDESSRYKTVWDIAERSFIEYEDQAALGTREYLYEDDQKRKVFGETTWETYGELGENARDFGAGLRLLGLQPLPQNKSLEATTGPHTMLLYEDTCANWITALLGAHSQSIVVATSYATLGIQAVKDAIEECSVAVVVCNRKNVKEVAKIAPKVLKTIIYTNHYALPKERGVDPVVEGGGVRVISMDEVVRLGHAARGEISETPPSKDNLAVIMYTSGSTGKPKGVMIAHRNVAASLSGLTGCFTDRAGGGEGVRSGGPIRLRRGVTAP